MNTDQPPNPLGKIVDVLQTVFPATAQVAAAGGAPTQKDDYAEEWSLPTRTGKIARLPAEVRETVNSMLHSNTPYASIIQKLEQLGYPGFLPCNISRWKEGGYADWISERQTAAEIKARSQWTQQLLDDLKKQDGTSLDEALHLVISNQLLSAFSRITSEEIYDTFRRSESLTRLFAAANGHLRERTRFAKLQLLLRQYEESKAAAKDGPQTSGATE